MSQEIAPIFGNGSDGEVTLSGTDAPIDSACTGSLGATSLSATNASFAAGQLILIHQTRGTGAGQWEINKIASYVAGTITTLLPLSYAYASGAQVLVLKQYSKVTVSGTFTAKAWDQAQGTGGILAFLCNGLTLVSGTITATGKGFSGGAGGSSGGDIGVQGSSYEGTPTNSTSANNSGGGGGRRDPTNGVWSAGAAGGGGGYGTSGGNGQWIGGANTGVTGTGGSSVGSADLTSLYLGGGGGGGGADDSQAGGAGGNGGGAIYIASSSINISGSVISRGNSGGAGTGDGSGSGGSGSGGPIFIKTRSATLGSGLVVSTGGDQTNSANTYARGGTGGDGRIRIECCSRTGSTNPAASESVGGKSYCGSGIQIL